MLRRLAVLAAAALFAAPAAAADGPGPGGVQGGSGVVPPDGGLRYVAVGAAPGQWTLLEAIRTRDGTVASTASLYGDWGLPQMVGGSSLSHDGSTLVLSETQISTEQSKFLVYDPRDMTYRAGIVLNGAFTFDALSPDGSRLYLIQQKYGDGLHYVVRAYDLERQRLLPGRIADRTQRSWVMQGYPMTRTESGDGRWVYTLYTNPGGYPFVHALDTVRGVAHCVGLPIVNQNPLYNVVLTLHGKRLAVHWRSGRPWYDIDTTTWRVTPAHGSFPWWTLSFAVLPLLGVAAFLARRRRTRSLDAELAGLLRLEERRPVRL
jgi:MYXO-CTERM domain-containing protein